VELLELAPRLAEMLKGIGIGDADKQPDALTNAPPTNISAYIMLDPPKSFVSLILIPT
jgi:hypothetical protein